MVPDVLVMPAFMLLVVGFGALVYAGSAMAFGALRPAELRGALQRPPGTGLQPSDSEA